jgi:hypothetical protein
MSLLNQIERLHYHLLDHNEIDWDLIEDLIVNEDISAQSLKKLIDYFVRNLSNNHIVPGKIYQTLCGIGDFCSIEDHYTSKQFRFVYANLATYYDQIDPFK